jgi:2-aminomuconate deaminase
MTIHSVGAPKAVGAYPHAKKLGSLLFLSGIGPRTPGSNAIPGNVYSASGELEEYDIAAQTHAVIANVKTVLASAGLSLSDLIDITVYLTNMKQDFPTYNQIWAQYFDVDGPARTTLGITALPTPIAIELKCIAAFSEPTR